MNKIISIMLFVICLPFALYFVYKNYHQSEYQCKSPEEIDYERYQRCVDFCYRSGQEK